MFELGGVQDIDGACDLFGRGIGGEFNPDAVRSGAFFGGNQDNSVGRSGAVNSCCGSVLEHREGFDVFGVDEGQGIGRAGNTAVIHRYTVDHDQRIVAGVQRGTTADTNNRTTAGKTAVVGDTYSGCFADDELFRCREIPLLEDFGRNGRDRSG